METPLYRLRPEEQLLLVAARVRLDGHMAEEATRLIAQVTDWQHFIRKAMETHLAPMLFKSLHKLNDPKVPQEVLTTLQKSYYAVLAANTRLYAHFGELAAVWNSEGIDIVPLKGIYLAEMVYGDIGLRHLSDIDLLLRTEDLNRCVETGQELGWEVKETQHHSRQFTRDFGTAHPFKLIKGNTVVELHTHVHNRGKAYEIEIGDYWNRTISGRLSGHSILRLNPTDLLQHLVLHLYKHTVATELKISSFCDIREVLSLYGEEIDWEYFRESSLQYNVFKEMQGILYICQEYWQIPIPGHILYEMANEDGEVTARLFLRYFREGQLDEATKVSRHMGGSFERLQRTKGVGAKFRYLQNSLFPSAAYLRQRYGNASVAILILRIYHPVRITVEGMRFLLGRWLGKSGNTVLR